MRIVLDATTLLGTSRFRGIGTYCRELVGGLVRRPDLLQGIDLSLLLGPAGEMRVLPLAEAANRLEQSYADSPVLGDLGYWLMKHTVAARSLRRARPDLYHSLEPVGTPRPHGARMLVTCHDLIPIVLDYPYEWPFIPRRLRITMERRRWRGVDHAIVISRCTGDDLRRIVGLPEERTSLVYHGLDHRRFNPDAADGEAERVARAIGSQRPYLLYVGGFDARRQVPEMIEAFARRAAEMDQVLVICGNVRPLNRPAIDDLLRRYDLADRVLLPGFVDADLIPALYRQATAHVMLSRYEGFGMTAVEAMACGCPVLALASSCVPEIVGDAALLVAPDATNEVGPAMVRLANDRALQADLRQLGIERAQRYTWERCAEQTVAAYRRATS